MTPFISSNTGMPIDNDAAVHQSIVDLIMTPIGSRIARRAYGCNFTNLLDAPLNARFLMQMKAVIVSAMRKWLPKIDVQKIEIAKKNSLEIKIFARRLDLPTNPKTTITFGV